MYRSNFEDLIFSQKTSSDNFVIKKCDELRANLNLKRINDCVTISQGLICTRVIYAGVCVYVCLPPPHTSRMRRKVNFLEWNLTDLNSFFFLLGWLPLQS